MNTEIVSPIIALLAWTMVVWLWMYAARIPAIRAANIQLEPNAPRGEQMSMLPPRVRWKADNFNHLMEQPTVFYVVAICLALIGEGEGINLYLAWAYVILRVLHSLIQILWNKIEVRFLLFIFSNIPLLWLIVNAAIAQLS